MTPGVQPDISSQIPDLPRWIDARGLLLSRRGFLVDAGDGCRVVCGRADRLIVPVTFDLTRELDAFAAREVAGPATIVLQEVMLPSARWLLQDWEAVPATVYALEPERAREWRLPQWQTGRLRLPAAGQRKYHGVCSCWNCRATSLLAVPGAAHQRGSPPTL